MRTNRHLQFLKRLRSSACLGLFAILTLSTPSCQEFYDGEYEIVAILPETYTVIGPKNTITKVIVRVYLNKVARNNAPATAVPGGTQTPGTATTGTTTPTTPVATPTTPTTPATGTTPTAGSPVAAGTIGNRTVNPAAPTTRPANGVEILVDIPSNGVLLGKNSIEVIDDFDQSLVFVPGSRTRKLSPIPKFFYPVTDSFGVAQFAIKLPFFGRYDFVYTISVGPRSREGKITVVDTESSTADEEAAKKATEQNTDNATDNDTNTNNTDGTDTATTPVTTTPTTPVATGSITTNISAGDNATRRAQ